MSDMSQDRLLTGMLNPVSAETISSVLDSSQRRTALHGFRKAIDSLDLDIDRLDEQIRAGELAATRLAELMKRLMIQRDHLRKGRDGMRAALQTLERDAGSSM